MILGSNCGACILTDGFNCAAGCSIDNGTCFIAASSTDCETASGEYYDDCRNSSSVCCCLYA